jgi:hypothetical protein
MPALFAKGSDVSEALLGVDQEGATIGSPLSIGSSMVC